MTCNREETQRFGQRATNRGGEDDVDSNIHCAHPGRYELHVWYPKSFPSHSSAPSWRYPSPQYACLHSARGGGVMLYAHSEAVTNVPATTPRLTDAAVRDDPVLVIALLPPGNLHDPIAAVTVIVRSVFHGLEWRQLEWERLLQSFKKRLRGECPSPVLKVLTNPSCYLDREPSVEVFEIERSLVFAECERVICVEALHLLITVHNEDLNKAIREAEPSVFMLRSSFRL